jgi:hypothetical protein
MTTVPIMQSSHYRNVPRNIRAGTSTLDALVACTLLVTVVSVATPLVVRHTGLLKSQRNYRLALDELSNQLEHLTALRNDELAEAVDKLAPSAFLTERIPSAELSGELQPAETGTRVTLKLSWNESQVRKEPLSLAAWVIPAPQPSAAPEEGQP